MGILNRLFGGLKSKQECNHPRKVNIINFPMEGKFTWNTEEVVQNAFSSEWKQASYEGKVFITQDICPECLLNQVGICYPSGGIPYHGEYVQNLIREHVMKTYGKELQDFVLDRFTQEGWTFSGSKFVKKES